MELGGVLNMPGKGPLPSVPRYVYLDRSDELLAYGKTEEKAKDKATRKILLKFSGILTITHKDNQVIVEVLRGNKKTRYRLYAQSADDAQFWAESIEDAKERFKTSTNASETTNGNSSSSEMGNDSMQSEEFCFTDRNSSHAMEYSPLASESRPTNEAQGGVSVESTTASTLDSATDEAQPSDKATSHKKKSVRKSKSKQHQSKRKSDGVPEVEAKDVRSMRKEQEEEVEVPTPLKPISTSVPENNPEEPKGLSPAVGGGLDRKGKDAKTAVEKMIEKNMLDKKGEVYGLYGKKIPESITKPFLPIELEQSVAAENVNNTSTKAKKGAKKSKPKKKKERIVATNSNAESQPASDSPVGKPQKKRGLLARIFGKVGRKKKEVTTTVSNEEQGEDIERSDDEEVIENDASEEIEGILGAEEEDTVQYVAEPAKLEPPKTANFRASMAVDIARRSVMAAKIAQQEEKKPIDEDISEEERKARVRERMAKIAQGAQGGGQYTTGMALVPFAQQMKESKLAKDLEARRSVLPPSKGGTAGLLAQQALAAHSAKTPTTE